jgi:hypothetical protein
MAGNPNLPTENINEVILRLLKLNAGIELDYQTYFNILKKRLALGRLTGNRIPFEEQTLLEEELKRVWRIKDKGLRFKIKTKKIKVTMPSGSNQEEKNNKTNTSQSNSRGKGSPPPGGKIVKSPKQKLSKERFFYNPPVEEVSVKDVTKKKAKVSEKTTDSVLNILQRINKSLDSIIKTLIDINKESRKRSDSERKDAENRKREGKEKDLESKTFEGIKNAVKTILKPFQSIWDRIVNFITNIILGRIVIKLIDWIADPKNQGKIQSIIRFFSDHWPTLLALYLRFGTGLGRFIGKLGGILVKGAFRLGAFAAKLLARAGLKGAGKVAGFLGGKKGKAVATGIGIAADVAVTAGTAFGISSLFGGSDKKAEPVPPTQEFAGGGAVRYPKFAGGGFANFGKMFGGAMSGASLGSMFGPMGMLLGAGIGGAKESGFVSGQKGVDKVPAMLSDGEFVMSVGAVNKYGVETLEAMNAAGGGTNQPKIVGGKTYAASGGRIGNNYEEDSKTNLPFSKNPTDAVRRFIEHKFGVKLNNPSSWGPRESGSSLEATSRQSSLSTGSLLNNPMGAINRIASRFGTAESSTKTPTIPRSGVFNSLSKKVQSFSDAIKSKFNTSKKSSESKKDGFFPEDLKKLKSSTFRDAGAIYAKQMLGGFDGPVSERDLSKESQQELQKAIQRAKKRTGLEIRKAEDKIKKLRDQGAKDGNPALEMQKSFLKKLKSGGIRVQYTDYADEKGKMSESSENAKNILGQFWATERSKKEGGGYRIEDKYDFDYLKKKVKDPKTGKMVERDLDQGELIKDVIFGKGKDLRQRLQAAYLLNPLKGKGDVDMVLGGKRTAAESIGLTGSKTLLGGMLGISGKPKDKNTKLLEAKRPWWDKMGWFGGGSSENQRQAKVHNQAKISKSKTAPKPPVKPLSSSKKGVRFSNTNQGGAKAKSQLIANGSNSQKPRSQSPNHSSRSTRTARTTLGITKSASAYGNYR